MSQDTQPLFGRGTMETFLKLANCPQEWSERSMELDGLLQVLTASADTGDLYIKENSREAVNLQHCIYRLLSLSSCSRSNPLLWSAVTFLCHLCSSHSKLSHEFRSPSFLSLVTPLLAIDGLERERKHKVLALLRELTLGIHVAGNEPYLWPLFQQLIPYIGPHEKDITVAEMALAIINNLCQVEIVAVYSLCRCMDKEAFLKTLLIWDSDHPGIRLQVNQLLKSLDNVTGGNLPLDQGNLAKMHLKCVVQSICSRSWWQLYQARIFFASLSSAHMEHVILPDDCITALVDVLRDTNTSAECASLVLELLSSMVSTGMHCLAPFLNSLVSVCIYWVTEGIVPSIDLLLAIVKTYGDKEDVTVPIISGLPSIVTVITSAKPGRRVKYPILVAVVRLMQELLSLEPLRHSMEDVLSVELFQHIVQIINHKDQSEPVEKISLLVTDTLVLLSLRARGKGALMQLFSELSRKRCLLDLLAVSLLRGDENIKRKTLSLIGTVGFSSLGISFLATSLCNQAVEPPVQSASSPLNSIALPPLLADRVERIVIEFETFLRTQKPNKSSTLSSAMESSALELFGLSIQHMKEVKDIAVQNAVDVEKGNALLRVQNKSQESQILQLHKAFQKNNLILNAICDEKTELLQMVSNLETNLKQSIEKSSADLNQTIIQKQTLHNELEEKNVLVMELQTQLKYAEELCKVHNEDLKKLKESIKKKEAAIKDIQDQLSKSVGVCESREKTINDMQSEMNLMSMKITNLSQDLSSLETLRRVCESKITEKEKEVREAKKETQLLQQKLDTIGELTWGRRPNNN